MASLATIAFAAAAIGAAALLLVPSAAQVSVPILLLAFSIAVLCDCSSLAHVFFAIAFAGVSKGDFQRLVGK